MTKTAEPEQNLPGKARPQADSALILVQAPAAGHDQLSPTTPASAERVHFVQPAASAVLERTHELVSTHALRLQQTAADALHVVIQPADDVRISLDLRQHQGEIVAQASLHRGDFESLSRRWTELQDQLRARGVSLGSLQNCSPGQPQFQSREDHNRRSHDDLPNSAFADFAFAGFAVEKPSTISRRAKNHNGWETWA